MNEIQLRLMQLVVAACQDALGTMAERAPSQVRRCDCYSQYDNLRKALDAVEAEHEAQAGEAIDLRFRRWLVNESAEWVKVTAGRIDGTIDTALLLAFRAGWKDARELGAEPQGEE